MAGLSKPNYIGGNNRMINRLNGYLMTQPQVAEVLGVGQQSISKAERSLLAKIRYALLSHGFTEDDFESFIKYNL